MKNKKNSLIRLSVFTLGMTYIINKWIDSSSTAKQASSANGRYYHWKQGDIFYKQFGETGKTPLLLIHELSPFHASFEWNELVDALKEDFSLYVLDLPGCGKSDKPAIPYTNYFFVQMITDFVKEVIQKPTHVAATGLSGSFILMADQLDQKLFTQIVLINPASLSQLNHYPDNRSKVIQALFDLPFIGTTAYYMITNHMNTEYYWTEKKIFNPFSIDRRILKASYDASHAGNGFGKYLLRSIDGNYLNVNISKALSSTQTPLHLIFGSHNPGYQEAISEYRKLNQNISAEIMSECMMYPQIELPEEILESFYSVFRTEEGETNI